MQEIMEVIKAYGLQTYVALTITDYIVKTLYYGRDLLTENPKPNHIGPRETCIWRSPFGFDFAYFVYDIIRYKQECREARKSL